MRLRIGIGMARMSTLCHKRSSHASYMIYVNALRCREMFPSAGRDALLLPINDTGEPNFGSWEDKEDTIRGSLPEHFYSHDSGKASRLMCTLQLIADSWNVDRERLFNLEWSRNKNSWICGHLVLGKL